MGFLYLGRNDAKKAAKRQEQAVRDSARLQTIAANSSAEASAQSMALAQQNRAESRKAEDLLSKPMESATVDLAAPDEGDGEDDLLTRRRTTRQTYQADRRSGLAV